MKPHPLTILFLCLAIIEWTFLAQAGEIHDAAEEGDAEKVQALIKTNPDLVNAKEENGMTTLHLATQCNRKAVVEVLLANKAAVNEPDEDGWTPLHVAAIFGRREVAKLLLANKADVRAKDCFGRTPLRLAMMRNLEAIGQPGITDLLQKATETNPPAK